MSSEKLKLEPVLFLLPIVYQIIQNYLSSKLTYSKFEWGILVVSVLLPIILQFLKPVRIILESRKVYRSNVVPGIAMGLLFPLLIGLSIQANQNVDFLSKHIMAINLISLGESFSLLGECVSIPQYVTRYLIVAAVSIYANGFRCIT
jgi:hypothetical protein